MQAVLCLTSSIVIGKMLIEPILSRRKRARNILLGKICKIASYSFRVFFMNFDSVHAET